MHAAATGIGLLDRPQPNGLARHNRRAGDHHRLDGTRARSQALVDQLNRRQGRGAPNRLAQFQLTQRQAAGGPSGSTP